MAAASVLLVVFVLMLFRYAAHEPGVTLSNFQRLNRAMSLDEIHAILGRAPDNFESSRGGGNWAAFWHSEEGNVWIINRHGDVHGCFVVHNGIVESFRLAPDPWWERWVKRLKEYGKATVP